MSTDPLNRLAAFINERERVRIRKESKAKVENTPPWTSDPILSTYRFCNMEREKDRVTRWIAANWRNPNERDPDVWFAMAVARFINRVESLRKLEYPVPWSPNRFIRVLNEVRDSGERVFSGAYMIRSNACDPGKGKVEYLAERVFTPAWNNRARIRPVASDTLGTFAARLGTLHDFGTFMTGQVVADMKYTPPLYYATDWSTFALSGPGSRRGLNRVMGRDVDTKWQEGDWFQELQHVREWLKDHLAWGLNLHAQDVQNCLCEFDKYERARLGEGRPKQLYRSGR